MACLKQEWVLKRNCSMSPRQVGIAYGALCLLTFAVAAPFALGGLWIVPAFALLETTGLVAALLHYARHATDQEHIALSDNCLLVERIEAGRLAQVRLDPHWTRIAPPTRGHKLVTLESRGVKVDVGAFVSEDKRQQLARELRRELRGGSLVG
jgi:uncharacterized membrane protein